MITKDILLKVFNAGCKLSLEQVSEDNDVYIEITRYSKKHNAVLKRTSKITEALFDFNNDFLNQAIEDSLGLFLNYWQEEHKN